MARAASQSTIHPLDTMKVRMQAGGLSGAGGVCVCGGGLSVCVCVCVCVCFGGGG
jgi:hypothetical protein